ncbi:MAG TPA: pyridoxamine 5'-phosphate oxidase [Micromonosporaceae bacterium]|nr:pyridoxamine 5'-phosphate oxidase [Micromonosporaceae bacterium]HCU50819.1 pyridoxamine 5'-phosphate oxidase [Micromonosporaceae bacterium]
MTPDEASAFLAGHRKMQLATINRDGTPHLVSMFYVVMDGQIAFWTYRSSQKAKNMARDARVTCLVESGDDYFELQGVQVKGIVRIIEEPAGVMDIGRLVAADLTGVPADGLDDFVAYTARKRFGYLVEPSRVSSWDHRKLLT